MAGTDLNISITAKDGTTAVFKNVQSAAISMGSAVAKGAAQADKGLTQVQTSAKKTDAELKKMSDRATAVGAGLGVLGGALIKLGESARTQDRLIDGLTRAYGDSADEILGFAENLQDTTRFSNDAAQASLLLANALSQNYGFAAEDMQLLLQRSADLAQIYGISLPDAMQRTSSAMRGEGESAEMLGLNLSDAAIAAKALEAGLVGWNVPGALTESEKAAFRFKVFMEQSAFASGAAADAAESAGGKFRQFANELQDAGQSAGQFLGPIGEVAAEFAPIALLAPVVGAGIGKLGAAFKGATGSASLLAAATNPVVLGIVALTAALGVAYLIYQKTTEGQRELKESFESLQDAIDALGDSSPELAAKFQALDGELVNIAASGNFAADALEAALTIDPNTGAAIPTIIDEINRAIIDGMDSTAEDLEQANNKITEALNSTTVDLEAFLAEVQRLKGEMMALPDDAKGEGWFLDEVAKIDLSNYQKQADIVVNANGEILASMEDVASVTDGWKAQFLNLQFDGFREGALAVRDLAKAFEEGTAPVVKIVADVGGAIGILTDTLALNEDQLLQASIAYDRVFEAISSGQYDIEAITTELERLSKLNDPVAFTEGLSNLAYELENTDKYAKSLIDTMHDLASGMDGMATSAGAAALKQAKLAEAQDYLNQTAIAYIANGENILGFLVEMDADLAGATTGAGKFVASMLSSSDATLLLAYNLDEASDALDSVLATFSQIDALGSRSASAGSIADTLIGAPGELGTLQDLWARIAEGTSNATLAQSTYNAAISAGESIQQSNLNIQDDLLVIQAKQIPLLAEQTAAYEKYIHQLSQASAEEQQHALYLSDTANQSKIAELASLAYAASIGEIPMEAATDVILNAAQADPILASLLEQYGLIEIGANGEITVSIPDGESTIDVLTRIDQSIRNLVAVLDDDPLTIPIYVDDQATPVIDEKIVPALGVLENQGATVTVDAEDNVTGPVEAMRRAISDNPATLEVNASIAGLGERAGAGLADKLGWSDVEITATLNDEATAPIGELKSYADSVSGTVSTLEARLEDNATRDIESVDRVHRNLNGNLSTVEARLRDNATRDINAVDRLHRNLNGNLSTVKVNANTSNADSAINRIRALNGDTLATSYYKIVTIYSSIGSPGGGPGNNQHGGVIHKAHGGVIAELAEAGPEIVHFATGGSAVAGVRGLYNLTPGDYVSPSNASGPKIGGVGLSVNVTVQGNVYGIDDLTSAVTKQIAPALVETFNDYYQSMGVMY